MHVVLGNFSVPPSSGMGEEKKFDDTADLIRDLMYSTVNYITLT
jgi:hypothetical protein